MNTVINTTNLCAKALIGSQNSSVSILKKSHQGIQRKTKRHIKSDKHCFKVTAQIVHGTTKTVKGIIDPVITEKFSSLTQNGSIMAEYVWIGGTGSDLRSLLKIT